MLATEVKINCSEITIKINLSCGWLKNCDMKGAVTNIKNNRIANTGSSRKLVLARSATFENNNIGMKPR